ncbi:MAG: 50S ribosomal protein L25 [Holophagales bacterium]|nr:50S ribosomal protein L25 [Holophagales bacterium]MXX60770.1 50S ribosomal protein L25 [Holophagales bacterium]MYC11215.1 50S ribosomal protein L25 [Holophagales bacterium]MYD22530.1 50S ribosomal protein L25 [Holophagales bacterium]MYI34006.1 50S ribosomal protein L25 [Holophagales bacterium]
MSRPSPEEFEVSEPTVTVRLREQTGKNANRRLRAGGEIPAVIYGGSADSAAIRVDGKLVLSLIREGGENAVFLLQLEGTEQTRHTMIRDLQWNPLTGALVHIDFQRVKMDQEVQVSVPIEVVGVPEGVRNEGGLLEFITREVSVICLPGDIPVSIELDVSALHIGQHVEAGQLVLPDAVTLNDEESKVIVSVAAARVVEEEEEEPEEGELLEAVADEPERVGEEDESVDGEA